MMMAYLRIGPGKVINLHHFTSIQTIPHATANRWMVRGYYLNGRWEEIALFDSEEKAIACMLTLLDNHNMIRVPGKQVELIAPLEAGSTPGLGQ